MAKRQAVKADLQTSNLKPFKVSKDKPFNIAYLVGVSEALTEKEKPMLKFHFVDQDSEQEHIHYEFEIEGDSGKLSAEKKQQAQDFHIAHLYNAFMGDGAHAKAGKNGSPIGTPFEGKEDGKLYQMTEFEFADFFKEVVAAFETGKNGNPVYKTEKGEVIPAWIKLVYDDRGRIQFPLFGNFFEIYREGRDCLLSINPVYDRLEQPTSTKPNAIPITPQGNTVIAQGFVKGAPKF